MLHRVLGGGKTWPENMGLGGIHFESSSLEVENRAEQKLGKCSENSDSKHNVSESGTGALAMPYASWKFSQGPLFCSSLRAHSPSLPWSEAAGSSLPLDPAGLMTKWNSLHFAHRLCTSLLQSWVFQSRHSTKPEGGQKSFQYTSTARAGVWSF